MPDTDLPSARLLPLPRAVAIYGVSRSTLYRAAAAGRLRLVKLGSRTLVDVSSAEALAASLPEMVPTRGRPRKNAA